MFGWAALTPPRNVRIATASCLAPCRFLVIDEAIFLADRLIVMTNTPTRVRAMIEVNMLRLRPRRLANTFDNDDANQVKMQALSLLHEEAMKSFSGGSRAPADFVEAYSRRGSNDANASKPPSP